MFISHARTSSVPRIACRAIVAVLTGALSLISVSGCVQLDELAVPVPGDPTPTQTPDSVGQPAPPPPGDSDPGPIQTSPPQPPIDETNQPVPMPLPAPNPNPQPNPAPAPDITNTTNSITSAAGGVRSDPEGVAAPGNVNVVTWKDARGADRTMTLGAYLYEYDFSFEDGTQVVQRSANDDAWGHEGFGYVVSHNSQNGNSPLGKANAPTAVQTTVFDGGHHAIHRVEMLYDRDKEGGGFGVKIPVVIEWFVATGRDHPVWSVTWKTGEALNPNNVNFDDYRMDVRGPYGSLNFDGAATRNAGDAIGQVAWGDFGLKFKTLDALLTLNSPWTYDTPNSVCFTYACTANVNAEMGIVQTKAGDKEMGYADRVYNRERGASSALPFMNRGDCGGMGDARVYTMPCVNGWPYQLMNYDWDASSGKPIFEATGTKLMAWGTQYGWLGSSGFDLFDYSASRDGRGDRSYATFIVLGPKVRFNAQSGMFDAPGDVAGVLDGVAALSAATISNVTVGSVATQVAKGPGASQMKPLVNGYNDTYAAYCLQAASNEVAFTLTPAIGTTVQKPIFIVSNYTSRKLPVIRAGNVTLSVNDGTSNSGAFVSINAATNELWITINGEVVAAVDFSIKLLAAGDAVPQNAARLPDGQLFTQGNHIYIRDAAGAAVPFRARGANLQDTRGCGSGLYEPGNADEVIRRANVLTDDWGANFVRLTLESRPIPENQFARPAPGVLADAAYFDEVERIVTSLTAKPGVYVLLSLWIEPSFDAKGRPTPDTDAVWTALAARFVNNPKVIFGLVNEPEDNFDGAEDAAVWMAMNRAASAIRAVEELFAAPKHLILAQGTGSWARRLDYYINNPLTAGGGANIAYETHFYNPATDIDMLLDDAAQRIPVVIGEFGPDQGMTMNDCQTLMNYAMDNDIPYLAWTFHQNCPPNLIQDTRPDPINRPTGIDMPLRPTAWGQMLIDNLALPW